MYVGHWGQWRMMILLLVRIVQNNLGGSFPALRSQKAYILRSNKQDWILPCICSIRKTSVAGEQAVSQLSFLSLAKQFPPSPCFLPQIPNGFFISLGNLKITSVEQGVERSGRISYQAQRMFEAQTQGSPHGTVREVLQKFRLIEDFPIPLPVAHMVPGRK